MKAILAIALLAGTCLAFKGNGDPCDCDFPQTPEFVRIHWAPAEKIAYKGVSLLTVTPGAGPNGETFVTLRSHHKAKDDLIPAGDEALRDLVSACGNTTSVWSVMKHKPDGETVAVRIR